MRKAITPLISTILLLVFAIGLGTLVMSWGNSDHVEGCEDMSIDVTTLNGKPQICYDNNNLNILLENNGKVKISKIDIILLNDIDYTSISTDVNIEPGRFQRVSIPLQNSKILKIRVIPNTYMDSCISKNIEFEQIETCNEN